MLLFYLGGHLGIYLSARKNKHNFAHDSYAQTLIVVVLIVVNFFGCLVIAPYPTMRF